MAVPVSKLAKLAEPFRPDEIKWLPKTAGSRNGKDWILCLAFMDARAVMRRLDEVCGPGNWQTRHEKVGDLFLCGIGIKVDNEDGTAPEWVWKWDGSDGSDIEEEKGGLSGALKRSSTSWGVGRYLYYLGESFATIADSNDRKAKSFKTKEGKWLKWYPPELPEWALPGGAGSPQEQAAHEARLDFIKEQAKAKAVPEDLLLNGSSSVLVMDALRAAGRDLPKEVALTRRIYETLREE